jgi:hypothetical protein
MRPQHAVRQRCKQQLLNHLGDLTFDYSLVDGECGGEIISEGYNIESPGSTCGFQMDGLSANGLGLGPLKHNGGPTETHALMPGSLAIDRIPKDECVLGEDQRGEPRPGGSMCDAGAFEVQP